MILIVLAGLCLLSVPATGGRLRRLADIRLRATWLPVLALVLQVVITVIATAGHPGMHRAVHITTYVMLGLFLWANRRLPGARILGLGAAANALAIIVNGGVMPASAWAERVAGMHLSAGAFANSAPVAHPVLPWLGDVIPWPGPLHNVLSVGDCLIYAGTLVLLHRVCRGQASGVASSRSHSSATDSNTAAAPASRSSCSEKPPVMTARVPTSAAAAALTSHGVSPTITASPRAESTALSAAWTRSGAGLVDSTSADVVHASASERASSRSR